MRDGMIGALMREQRRSQRRYARTTTVLIAIATALAAFAATQWATARVADQELAAALPWLTHDRSASVGVWTGGVGLRADGAAFELPNATLTVSELEAVLDGAHADGIEPAVQFSTYVTVQDGPADFTPVAMSDVPGAGAPLWKGTTPGPGEVALMASFAHAMEVGVGDTVTLLASPDVEAAPLTMTVSGLTRSDDPLLPVALPALVFAQEDLLAVAGLGGILHGSSEDGTLTTLVDATVSWDGEKIPELADLVWTDAPEVYVSTVPATTSQLLIAGAAGLIALVAVGAAMAAGRAQGEQRTAWVATARALGARRSHLIAAAATEGLVTGLVAGGVGIAAGWGAAAASRALLTPGLIGPDIAALPAGWALVLLALAVLVALAVSLIPALWATAVEPSAALRPTGPSDLRRPDTAVPARVLSWTGAAVAVAAALWIASAGGWLPRGGAWDYVGPVAGMVTVVACGAVAGLGLRAALPRMGKALARSGKPALILAADSLQHRTGGLVAGGAALLVTGFSTAFAVLATADPAAPDASDTRLAWWLGGALLMALCGLVMGLAEWMSRGAALREAATAGALGLDRHGRQVAAMVRTAVPMLAGAMVGATLGCAMALAIGEGAHLHPGWAVVTALGMAAVSAPGIGIAALFSARAVDARSPQEAMRASL